MDIKKLYALQKQLGRLLYDPTPEQTAWRDKMWNEGRFDEIEAHTRQAEEQFEYVEKQIEMAEAAEPSVGQKIVTNTLLNLPWGKGAKGTGIGSLLGIAEEEMGAAETQRLKDIEQKMYELNSVYQKEGRGLKEIEALEREKQGIMSVLSKTPLSPKTQARNLISETPTTGEADPIVEDIKKGLYDANRYWQAGVDEDSSLYDALENYKNLAPEGQEQVKDMLREDMFERLGLEDARAEVKFFSDSGAFDAELVDQYLNKELAGAYPKIFGKPRSYKAGGLIMNYGDYGRSYT